MEKIAPIRIDAQRPQSPRKVIYVLWSGEIGGREQCVLNLARNLDPAKYDAEVWCVSHGGVIAEEIRWSGVRVRTFSWGRLFNPACALKFAMALLTNNDAVFHLHTLERRILWMFRLCRCRRVVVHVHGELDRRISPRRWRDILSLRGAAYVCDAEWLTEMLRSEFGLCDFAAIPVGLPVRDDKTEDYSKWLNKSRDDDSHVWIGMVGRLSYEKGGDLFIEVARRIYDLNPLARFVVIGDGPERQRLEDMSRELGLEGAVTFLGMQRDLDQPVAHLRWRMDVVVVPSRSEGFPYVVLESMANTRPVVAFDLIGIREAVGDSGGAVLVPPGNVEEMAKSVVELLGNAEMRLKVGRAGHQRALDCFEIGRVARRMEEVYDKLT